MSLEEAVGDKDICVVTGELLEDLDPERDLV